MNKIKKGLITVIIIMIATITTLSGKVSASNAELDAVLNGSRGEGSTVSAGFWDLMNRKDLYCIQHGVSLRSRETIFTISKIVEIVGNTANGYTNNVNGALAYIFSRQEGYGWASESFTTAQRALYKYYYTWYHTVKYYIGGLPGPHSGDTGMANDAANALIAEAEAYAANIGNNSGEASILDRTNKDNINITTYIGEENQAYMRVGPFNWEFNGNITQLAVTNQSDSVISDVRYSVFNGTQEAFIDKTQIQSGRNFYITIKVNAENRQLKRITGNVHTSTPNVYTAKLWFLTHGFRQNLLLAQPGVSNTESDQPIDLTYNIDLTKELTIIKVNSRDEKVKLKGVGFVIKNKEMNKYVAKVGGKIIYVDNKNKATEFITDSNGKIKIEGLIVGTYIAYETKNPNYGYELLDQGIEINASTIVQTIKNNQKFIKLSGYVWQDEHFGKKTIRNDVYKGSIEDSSDKAFNNMIVRLKDNSGNIVKNTKGQLMQTKTSERGLYPEINGGEYQFIDVEIDKLSQYYVEFEYDGLIYQSVKVGDLTKNNTSKSTDKVEREILDKNFARIDSTGENKVNVNNKYTITYNKTVDHVASIKDSSSCTLHAKTKDAGCKLEKYFVAGQSDIKYINLGIYEKVQADLAIGQDLVNVNVGVNGYWHIYNYGSRLNNNGTLSNDSSTWNVGVKFRNSSTGTYKRAVYKADIEYQTEDKSKEMQVYLTYKVGLRNESTYISKVNNIVDYFDDRYTLVAAGTGLNSKNEITGQLHAGTTQVYNNDYKKVIVDVNSTIKPYETNYIYIQFKLEREAVLQIINNKETLYNITEINSYTIYKDNKGNTVAAVDKDSVPGNTKPATINTYEDDTDSAPPIQLELTNAREIAGTVFLDSTNNELKIGEIRQGNGIFDNKDTVIEGVQVTLHEINNSIADMVTTTDKDGNFKFAEYIPGQYNIIYTWGNRTYTVQDYKGTIYQSSRDQSNKNWYKDNIDTRYTDAIDNYNERLEIDKQVAAITDSTIYDIIENAYNGDNQYGMITKMNSVTPTMEFQIEYSSTVTDGTKDEVKFIVKNIDFGIVERARQQLDMEKRVAAFKIILSNGQVLLDATVDENGKLQGETNYLAYMGPSINSGIIDNGFIKAELDNEVIEGATLEIGYEIKAINNSEIEYMSEKYYKYGIKEGNIVTITPSAVVDYLDKDLVFEADKNPEWKQITIEELKALNPQTFDINNQELVNSKLIYYTEATAVPLKPNETVSVILNVSKLLTTTNDATFNNDAETVKINKPDDATKPTGSIIKYFPGDSAEEAEITPSTGANRDYILPTSIGIISLVILGLGTFVIKKKVLR